MVCAFVIKGRRVNITGVALRRESIPKDKCIGISSQRGSLASYS
jgi:hypothetical protein